MTDKELLELAAKAADEKIDWDNIRDYGSFTAYRLRFENEFWNPLHDDGDALRLAVKLRLNLNFEEFDGVEYACAVPSKSHQGYDEPMGDDEEESVRRAFVSAAAEIGKAME